MRDDKRGITMKSNKLSILISVFNLFLIIFLFLGSSQGENGISIGSNCRLTEDGSNLKIVYDGNTRFIMNKSDGSITAGSEQGTGENAIYSGSLTAATVSGSLSAVPKLELVSVSEPTFDKEKAYIYQKSGKLIIAYMDDAGSSYYYWIELTQGSDLTSWSYSETEPE